MSTDQVTSKFPGWGEIIGYLVKQGPFLLILACLLYCLSTVIDYAIHVGVPEHLQQIQAGYEKVVEQNNATIEKLEMRHESERAQILNKLDRLQQRGDVKEINRAPAAPPTASVAPR